MSIKAEIDRGLVLDLNFENKEQLKKLGATVHGNPVVHYGIEGDGSSYVDLKVNKSLLCANAITLQLTFVPFDGPDTPVYFVDCTTGTRLVILKNGTGGTLRCTYNSSVLCDFPGAEIAPLWKINERNLLTICLGPSSDNVSYFNESAPHLDGSTFTPVDTIDDLKFLANNLASIIGNAKLESFKVYHGTLEQQEHIDAYRQTTYNYMQDALVHLPMDAERHDPTNSKTLDVSGNFNDGTLEATVEKLPTRGYRLPGVSSYIGLPSELAVPLSFSVAFLLSKTEPGTHTRLYDFTIGVPNTVAIDAASGVEVYNGTSWVPFGRIEEDQTGTLILAVDSAVGTITCYRDGEPLGSPVNITALLLSGSRSMLSNSVKGNNFLKTNMHEIIWFSKALTPTQAADLHNRLMEGVQNV